jgi:hypothetical protein
MKQIVAVLVIASGLSVGPWFHRRYLLDGADGAVLSLWNGDATMYAAAYSDAAFRQVYRGMAKEKVLELLGHPLRETWLYEVNGTDDIIVVTDHRRNTILRIDGPGASRVPALTRGVTLDRVRSAIGEPTRIAWAYSHAANDSSYRVRSVVIRNNHVERSIHAYYLD